MIHKVLTAVCALALVLSFSFSATAAVQNVKVGGDIEVKGIYQNAYDIYDKTENALGVEIYNNDPIVHDYLIQIVRLYVDASLTDNVSAYIRVMNERDWDTIGTVSDDVNIDLAYLTLSEMYGYPCSLTIGRQELLYGEGFLVGDGMRVSELTYQYDARKAFDAIKAVWDYEPHQFDLFIAKVTEGSNFGPLGLAPVDTDNDLYGVNWNYDGGMYGLWDVGLFYNTDDPLGTDGENNTWALSIRGEGTIPQIDVGTLALKGEIVKEWGTVDGIATATGDEELLDAWGGYVEGEYTFDNVYAPYLGLGYIYMSGDNADNKSIQMFNPLFEDETYGEIAEVLYGLYYLTGDTMVTNASIWKLSAGVNPTENTALDLTFYSLTADEPVFSATGDLDDQNLYIGSEYDVTFNYNYSEDVTFGLMYALFIPGQFFDDASDDVGIDINLSNAQQLMGSVKVTF